MDTINLENDSNIDAKTEILSDAVADSQVFGDTKFKDAESLLKAYNMLQTDYTKKCQALSTLQKQMDSSKTPEAELEAMQSWKKRVEEFFEKNPKAKTYSDALCDIIKTDADISKSTDPLEKAWEKFAKENFVDKKTLASDENFLNEYIFSNEMVKNKILSDYFCSLDKPVSPSLIARTSGASMILSPKQKPRTIRDATKLAEDMFDL